MSELEPTVGFERSAIVYAACVGIFDAVLSRLFPLDTLDTVRGPSRVRLTGTLLGEEIVVSPMTGRQGVFLEWQFWDRHVYRAPIDLGRKQEVRHDVTLAGRRMGHALILDVAGRSLMVPMTGAVEVVYASSWDPNLVLGRLPDGLLRAHPAIARAEEELMYDERFLQTGQRVLVSGWAEPTGSPAGGGAYRSGPGLGWEFRMLPDRGPIRVCELALVLP